ncbi:hypothetical protein [Nocardioides sp.]|uniref:hypothetical protein n=1 Tax=Nocardioides sp. TaxID=35761 RepID=UPI002B26FE34|nr:hypothetical protein [Nocardioides sp.]
MSDVAQDRNDQDDQDDQKGQVSEVSGMDPAEADTPVSDDQSVAGSPSDESGEVDAGITGPNSKGGAEVNGGDTA